MIASAGLPYHSLKLSYRLQSIHLDVNWKILILSKKLGIRLLIQGGLQQFS